jgi:hypothetical protein
MLSACKDAPISPDDSAEEVDQTSSEMTQTGPVTECDESLSAYEMKEMWEMSNAKVHDGRNICFVGYVLNNQSYGDLYQGSIAFSEFSDQNEAIPAVFCQFTGLNGKSFMDYEIGERIEIKGKLICADNPDEHNFTFVKCSLPNREKY